MITIRQSDIGTSGHDRKTAFMVSLRFTPNKPRLEASSLADKIMQRHPTLDVLPDGVLPFPLVVYHHSPGHEALRCLTDPDEATAVVVGVDDNGFKRGRCIAIYKSKHPKCFDQIRQMQFNDFPRFKDWTRVALSEQFKGSGWMERMADAVVEAFRK